MIDKIPNFDKLNLGIPGFYKKDGKWFIHGGEGILVSYRNEENEIIGYQIRIDQVKNFVTVDNKHKSDFKAFVYKQPNIVRVVNEDGELILENEFKLKEEMYIETKDADESTTEPYLKINPSQVSVTFRVLVISYVKLHTSDF